MDRALMNYEKKLMKEIVEKKISWKGILKAFELVSIKSVMGY